MTTTPFTSDELEQLSSLLSIGSVDECARAVTARAQRVNVHLSCGHEWRPTAAQLLYRPRDMCQSCLTRARMGLTAAFEQALRRLSPLSDHSHDEVRNMDSRAMFRGECGHDFTATVRDATEETFLCPPCRRGTTSRALTLLGALSEYLPSNFDPAQVTSPSALLPFTGACGHEAERSIADFHRSTKLCKECQRSSHTSGVEEEVAAHIEALGFLVERSNRTLLKGKELDIVLPGQKVAIEVNGSYWHSDALSYNAKTGSAWRQHQAKVDGAARHGYVLLFIWDDDWSRRTGVVKDLLASYLTGHVSHPDIIFSRLTSELDGCSHVYARRP